MNVRQSMIFVGIVLLCMVMGCSDDGVPASDDCLAAVETGSSCEEGLDCPTVICECEDGETGFASICVSGGCGDPESLCNNSCEFDELGEWTGECTGVPRND